MGTTEFYLLPFGFKGGFSLLRDHGSRQLTEDEVNPERAASRVGRPSREGKILKWSEVDWDDTLSRVTRSVGCLALSDIARKRLERDAKHPAEYGDKPIYEFMSIVRWSRADSRAVRRYRGFHVEVLGKGDVLVRQLRGHRGEKLVRKKGFDWARCDAVANGYSKLDATARAGRSGAVFIEAAYAKALRLRDPKLPFGS